MCEEIVKDVLLNYSTNPENAFQNLKVKLKGDLISKKEIWIIRRIAYELRNKFFNEKVKDITSINDLKKRYDKFKKQIDLDDLYLESEKIIDSAINSNDYNKFLRYYDNKNMFSQYKKEMKLKNNLKYEEVVFEYLNNHKEKLQELRDKYFPSIKF